MADTEGEGGVVFERSRNISFAELNELGGWMVVLDFLEEPDGSAAEVTSLHRLISTCPRPVVEGAGEESEAGATKINVDVVVGGNIMSPPVSSLCVGNTSDNAKMAATVISEITYADLLPQWW